MYMHMHGAMFDPVLALNPDELDVRQLAKPLLKHRELLARWVGVIRRFPTVRQRQHDAMQLASTAVSEGHFASHKPVWPEATNVLQRKELLVRAFAYLFGEQKYEGTRCALDRSLEKRRVTAGRLNSSDRQPLAHIRG